MTGHVKSYVVASEWEFSTWTLQPLLQKRGRSCSHKLNGHLLGMILGGVSWPWEQY